MNYFDGVVRNWFNFLPMLMELITLSAVGFHSKCVWFIPNNYIINKITDTIDIIFLPSSEILKLISKRGSNQEGKMNYLSEGYTTFSACLLAISSLIVFLNILRTYMGLFQRISYYIYIANTLFFDVLLVSIISFCLSGLDCDGYVFSLNASAYMSGFPIIKCDGNLSYVLYNWWSCWVIVTLSGTSLIFLSFGRKKLGPHKPRIYEFGVFEGIRCATKISIAFLNFIINKIIFEDRGSVYPILCKNIMVLVLVSHILYLVIYKVPCLGI